MYISHNIKYHAFLYTESSQKLGKRPILCNMLYLINLPLDGVRQIPRSELTLSSEVVGRGQYGVSIMAEGRFRTQHSSLQTVCWFFSLTACGGWQLGGHQLCHQSSKGGAH